MFYWLRLVFLFILDILIINTSVYVSLWLRFEGLIPQVFWHSYISLIPYFTVILLASLYFCRLYNRMWQYASIGELYSIIKAVTTGILLVVLFVYTIPLPTLPRSVYIMSWVIMIGLVGGSRLGWRLVRNYVIQEAASDAKRTLIIGAGDAGALVARELLHNQSLGLIPVGFIDDNNLKQNLSLFEIPVLGTRKDIGQVVKQYRVEEIIIAMPSATGNTFRDILEICKNTCIKVRVYQGPDVFLGKGKRFREIELEDLLRREPIKLDMEEISSYISNKRVLISGAGGSIGSELCRQICLHDPQSIILIENSENNLFEIENELRESFVSLQIGAYLCDVKDRNKLQEIFSCNCPDVVFHAAAHKHVPMMERHPEEAIKNNILGTKNIAELSDKYGVKTFILISTDKAVNPSSVMGASKRIAEMLIQDINKTSNTRFAAVRFGNVLGSRGSVVPIFKKQIERGGPVTITHIDMKRYFMTIPEAVELVIQAGAIAEGGEIFVLDMGEPVKIIDLANDLIKLYGYEPGKDIQIEFTGIRPGEKLYEELFSTGEQMAATRYDRIFISHREEDYCFNNIRNSIDRLFIQNIFINKSNSVQLITQILPEFRAEQNVTISKPVN